MTSTREPSSLHPYTGALPINLHLYRYYKFCTFTVPKSAFTTVFGKFKFLRIPFGLSQGPDLSIWLVYDLFRLDNMSNQGQGSAYLAYLDDILIYSKTEKEHLLMIEKAFRCLLNAGLKIKLNKCLFFKEQIHYLGHLVSGTSILPLAYKTEALMKLKPLFSQTHRATIRN